LIHLKAAECDFSVRERKNSISLLIDARASRNEPRSQAASRANSLCIGRDCTSVVLDLAQLTQSGFRFNRVQIRRPV